MSPTRLCPQRGCVLYAGGETARLARRWLKVAGIAGGPLFRPVNKAGRAAETRLTVRSVRSIVKRCAEDSGVGGRVSGHSLRVGAGQSLRAAGATMAELMAAGRWTRVDTVARYTREQDAASGAVACLRHGAVPLHVAPTRDDAGATVRAGHHATGMEAAAQGREARKKGREKSRAKKSKKRLRGPERP